MRQRYEINRDIVFARGIDQRRRESRRLNQCHQSRLKSRSAQTGRERKQVSLSAGEAGSFEDVSDAQPRTQIVIRNS